MREDVRRRFERKGISIFGRSIVVGLLVAVFIGMSAGSAASANWQRSPGSGWRGRSAATQSITFTSTPPSSAVVGGTYTVTASGGASGNPVTFSIDASAKGSCSISGATVTFVAVGTCVVDANQAGNANYQAATQVQQSFAVRGTQRITFTSTAPSSAVVGGTYTVAASGGASGNPVTFSVDASAKGSCTLSGAKATFVAAGTCVIDANQAGNASYVAATQVQQSFAVFGTQSITFTSTPPSSALVGATYTVTATGGASGNPVTFSIDASAKGSCSISGATVTFVAAGTCVIDANQAGNASYQAATQVQQSFDPDPGTQSITFTSTPPSSALVGGTYTVTASGGASGNPITFSIDASAKGSCTISGATVTFIAVGTCVIDANQAGNANYEAAAQVQQTVDPELGAQSITFTSTPPSSVLVGATYTVTASGGASGNPVTFSIDASANGSCSISGATVTFVAVGTCVIDANQAGNANYEAATQVQQSFAVLGTQTITFTSTPPSSALVGGTYTVTASGGASGNPVTFSVDASAKGSCTLSGAKATFVAAGTCVIDANQAGSASYQAAIQVQQSFAVLGTQSITFTSTPPSSAVVGATYTVTASGGASGNPVTFSIDASANGSCSISGATVTFVAAGTCVLDANQAGNASYQAATQVQQSFTVSASGSTSGGSCTNPYITLNNTTVTTSTDSTGTWLVDQDEWSSSAPQSMAVCSPSSWTVTTDQTAQSGNGVDTYPSTEYDVGGRNTIWAATGGARDYSIKPISAYNSITSTFSEAFPTTGDSFDAAYDLWTDNWAHETMIWNQWGGTQSYWGNCALNPATSVSVCGNQSYAVTLGGVAYDAMELGTEVIFFRDTQVASGSVDILAAYDFEVSMGWAQSTDAPTQLQYGIEICSTTGSQVFPLTGLTFNLS